VLALTVKSIDETSLAVCEALGVLAGYLIATHNRVTDLYGLRRRRKTMSLAASMQWDLLPPLTVAAPGVAAAGTLEPAYEIGGDVFDYALNGSMLDLAVMDAMGHGVGSAMVAALAAGCYRHGRRAGRLLEQVHRDLHEVIAAHSGEVFVTGVVGRLDLHTGTFSFVNAGHPAPLLVRRGHVVGAIDAADPRLPPWGVDASEADAHVTNLEPGDSVLLYTDGVTDARGSRHPDFGLDRLVDLVNQRASEQLPVGLTVRLVTRAVLEHHQGHLHDDATVLMVHWEPNQTVRASPSPP
jgi:serine phosphatase RsbU (regulator of sigma subunit)